MTESVLTFRRWASRGVHLWPLGRWLILVGMWGFTLHGCCHCLSVILDSVRRWGKQSPTSVFIDFSWLWTCGQLLQAPHPWCSCHQGFHPDSGTEKMQTFSFKLLFCRYSIFISFSFDFYSKFFPINILTMLFPPLPGPLYLPSHPNAHSFFSLIRKQISNSNKKK